MHLRINFIKDFIKVKRVKTQLYKVLCLVKTGLTGYS